MSQAHKIFGFAGTIIVAIAYVPQIVHLARKRCSAGVSLHAWLLWLLGSVLIFAHALVVMDVVFITLQAVNILAMFLIIVLCKRYTNMVCAAHKVALRESAQSAP
ncbi:MAG TPA: PQ-loop repeat-containing protein [Thermoanaerobaculia bacterium]|nr:PQ-loop repeat-containing protein [Thermoanaerobaculia bacterium]